MWTDTDKTSPPKVWAFRIECQLWHRRPILNIFVLQLNKVSFISLLFAWYIQVCLLWLLSTEYSRRIISVEDSAHKTFYNYIASVCFPFQTQSRSCMLVSCGGQCLLSSWCCWSQEGPTMSHPISMDSIHLQSITYNDPSERCSFYTNYNHFELSANQVCHSFLYVMIPRIFHVFSYFTSAVIEHNMVSLLNYW